MAKATARNRKPIEKLDVFNLKEGVYLSDKAFGQLNPMAEAVSSENKIQYVFTGKLHKGEVAFIKGADLKKVIPNYEGYDHGFTLEGEAKNIFDVEGGLKVYNAMEKRFFCYTIKESKLLFTGDPEKEYRIYVTFYDNCNGTNNDRWAVIYAENM